MLFNFNSNTLIILAVVLILIFTAVFLYFNELQIPFLKYLSDLVYNLLTPVLNFVHNFVESIKNFFTTLFSIDEINQELEILKRKNSVLERQILFLENIQRENKRLREILNFKEKNDYQIVGAKVIANSPSVWERIITINRGSKAGIETRMPVITNDGFLLGRIDKVGSNSAQVRLITDQNFVVGGIIARTESREIGLVRGSGRADQPNIMDSIAWDADIKVSDVILSSGLSNNFPLGLKIGKVLKVENDNYGLSQKAEIELYINQITVEEVGVITNFAGPADNEFSETETLGKEKENYNKQRSNL